MATSSTKTRRSPSPPGVLGNDSDVDEDPLTAALVSGPSHGTLVFNSAGSFTYTPVLNYNGSDSFAFTVTMEIADSNLATVFLTTSTPSTTPPWLTRADQTSDEGASVSFRGLASVDVDGDAPTCSWTFETAARKRDAEPCLWIMARTPSRSR